MENLGKMYRTTSFRNSGRKAGIGVMYDDYGDDDYQRDRKVRVRMPNDGVKPEDLNGPVICYKKGAKHG